MWGEKGHWAQVCPQGNGRAGPTKIGCVEGESSVQVGGVWSIAHVVADPDWKIVEPKKKLRRTFEVSQDSCTKYSQAGNNGDRGQRLDSALKGCKKLEGGDTKNISNQLEDPCSGLCGVG